jgi:hypothetical protein
MEGYAQLASRMSNHTDLAIFRRFGALNAQNFLYLQAELTELESRLRDKEKLNCQSDDERKRWYARDWHSLSKASTAEGGDESQWLLFLEIRAKLKEYSISPLSTA